PACTAEPAAAARAPCIPAAPPVGVPTPVAVGSADVRLRPLSAGTETPPMPLPSADQHRPGPAASGPSTDRDRPPPAVSTDRDRRPAAVRPARPGPPGPDRR